MIGVFMRKATCIPMLGSKQVFALKAKTRARKGKLARCWLFGIALFVLQLHPLERAESQEPRTNHYRQWAFIQLNNLDHFYCLDELNYKESRWNPKAKNGSHYGIPQGRSKWLSTVDGFKQIDWQLKYIKKRYDNPCNALAHHKIKGWY
jgi:hypothetical protein